MKNTRIKDIRCPYCDKVLKNNFIRKHIINEHNLTDVEWMVLSEQQSDSDRRRFPNVPPEIVKQYLILVFKKLGKLERYKIWSSQFNSFYRIVSHCRDFNEFDFNQFFDVVLPWQLEHPKTCNSRELCKLCHPMDDEMAEKAYHDLMEVRNPYYNHGGKFSPFSKNFVGYANLSNEEKDNCARIRARKNNDNIVHTTSLKYWLNKGYSEEEAKKKLSDRQRTFTLEKCIKKYGEELGIKVYNDRQMRWMNSIKGNPNIPSRGTFSYSSQALFLELELKRDNKNFESKFALNGDNMNNEMKIDRPDGYRYFIDYCIPELKCIIEYDGKYWHEGKEEYDMKRMSYIKELGYKVLVVTDDEYKKDRISTVNRCLEFIHQCGEGIK